MRIATWNINSVRARQDRLLAWLAVARPDVVCLQETKCTEAQFPSLELEAAGYHSAVIGQASYNGVAILSRLELANISRGLGGGADEREEARLIAADVKGVRVINAYFPNGQEVGTEQFAYKLRWMKSLREYLNANHTPGERVLLCGDFNVAPDDLDVAQPMRWAGSVLCCPPVRQALEYIREWGFVDIFRAHNPEGHIYSWWDYQQQAFKKDLGLRWTTFLPALHWRGSVPGPRSRKKCAAEKNLRIMHRWWRNYGRNDKVQITTYKLEDALLPNL